MWKFKPFMQKEQGGLEGRNMDIGNLKIQIRNAIAEGGFSCVYLARDNLNISKQYALKHIICNDEESLELVMREISVMKSLKGHPNVVSLLAHTILDMGRTKEAFLVMEFCEKSLVNVLERRGAGYFEEKQVLTIFRDVCNAVFAMHCQSPPVAHRDLKAENLLLGADGSWKLCDFGSISTNHKRFERPEEMGIEEDNIRKYTTPAYRAPEMWDLFRREVISEKVDIWALGCLLYRICYFKSAFDGESKLQILNGNYRIPELPKYSAAILDLIRDMLQASPDDRPDITQARALLDWPFISMNLGMQQTADNPDGGTSNPPKKSSPMPRRSPPPPPSNEQPLPSVKLGGGGSAFGAFWSTPHANDSAVVEDTGPIFDEPNSQTASKHDSRSPESLRAESGNPKKEQSGHVQPLSSGYGNTNKKFNGDPFDGSARKSFPGDINRIMEKTKVPQPENTITFSNESFNTFVAEFDTSKLDQLEPKKSGKEEALAAEVDRLKDLLKQANLEKDEITAKYEKLTAICRSQRQEIQELKQSLASRTPPIGDKNQNIYRGSLSVTAQKEKIEGSVSELRQGMFANSNQSLDSKQWQAFSDDSKSQTLSKNNLTKSVRASNGHQNRQTSAASIGGDKWGFGTDSFTAVPSTSGISRTSQGNSQHSNTIKSAESKQPSQPAGWAGF
ncbi:hypothetical protein Syun_017821 [Stephania yunnanensis]|uniref:non-specific serine/threonine protein kinase n=1 Tax=Stephania yunnanensis TaxID=152371 RepID=A0AAP0P3R3_9MAGN